MGGSTRTRCVSVLSGWCSPLARKGVRTFRPAGAEGAIAPVDIVYSQPIVGFLEATCKRSPKSLRQRHVTRCRSVLAGLGFYSGSREGLAATTSGS